jgi:hypothetical protein
MKPILLFLVAALCTLSSCESSYWSVQRSEAFVAASDPSANLISFRPLIDVRAKSSNYSAVQLESLKATLEKHIEKSAKKNHIKIDLQTAQNYSAVAFYEQLMFLQKSITDVCFDNYANLYSNGSTQDNKLVKSVYVYPPRLPFEINNFSKQFGSNYYSSIKLTVFESSFSLQHIVVDTDLSEVVYTERKTLYHRFNEDLLAQMVYDSFALLHQELKAK